LKVSESQASIKLTMTSPDAFIRWLTLVPSASAEFAVMSEGVISVEGVLDVLAGPQPHNSRTAATKTKRKGIISAPFGAASRKRIAVFAQNGHCGFRGRRSHSVVSDRFSIVELNDESRIQLSNASVPRWTLETQRSSACARGDDRRGIVDDHPVARDA
jgi:hypothetical protein